VRVLIFLVLGFFCANANAGILRWSTSDKTYQFDNCTLNGGIQSDLVNFTEYFLDCGDNIIRDPIIQHQPSSRTSVNVGGYLSLVCEGDAVIYNDTFEIFLNCSDTIFKSGF